VSGVEEGGAVVPCPDGPVREASTYSRVEMTAMLEAAVRTDGAPSLTAAVGLLAAAGLPGTPWFARHVDVRVGILAEEDSCGRREEVRRVRAWVRDWDVLVRDGEAVPAGTPAAFLVLLAASYASGMPVSLRDTVGRIPVGRSADVRGDVLRAAATAMGLEDALGSRAEAPGLPAYSGRVTSCRKCESRNVETFHHAVRAPSCMAGVKGGHMCRFCGNCGYLWPEQCADAEAAAAGSPEAVTGR
jgi:hypothetical protein